jgi:DNA polymerase III alpha subunit
MTCLPRTPSTVFSKPSPRQDCRHASPVTRASIDRSVYERRLRTELLTICSMGFAGYFLIVWDIIKFARSRRIPVGPGRGSAAGSLVAYALGITELDPLAYGLLFERFLNPDRISLPDIDMDFCMNRRQEVINYVTEKYGRDHVAQIITFGTLGAKAAIRDVGRVLEIPHDEVDTIAKLVPSQPNMTIAQALVEEPRLGALSASRPSVGTYYRSPDPLKDSPDMRPPMRRDWSSPTHRYWRRSRCAAPRATTL